MAAVESAKNERLISSSTATRKKGDGLIIENANISIEEGYSLTKQETYIL